MFRPDNTRVRIRQISDECQRLQVSQLKAYKDWLNERNIKYSFHYNPSWATYPSDVILRNEDALAFKLAFNL